MKIRKVTVAGFGPFKAEQVIDLTKYDAEGLFLIVGPTGAGKTSILDAITYALYGKTPRWTDTSVTKKNWSARSDYISQDEKTLVSLEFSDGTEIFKIEREIRVTAGTGKEAEKVTYSRWGAEKWNPIASGKTDAPAAVQKQVGLDEKEFLQVILLAQGRFDKALKASSTERLELMRTLFKTERFEAYKNRLKVIADAASSELATAEAGIKTEQNVLVGALAIEQDFDFDFNRDVPAAITQLKSELEQVDRDKKTADDALTAAAETLELAKAQTELTNALAALDTLKKVEPEIATVRKLVDAANRAAKVEALLAEWQKAVANKSEADAELGEARESFAFLTKETELSARRDSLVALKAKLEEKTELADELAGHQTKYQKLADELEALEAELAVSNEQIDGLKTERHGLLNLASELEPRSSIRDKAQILFDKSTELQLATKKLADLAIAEEEASENSAKAAQVFFEVLKGYNDSAAARLAENLKPGDACLVCGSTTHPAKHASVDGESVDEKQLETARKASETAASNLAAASEQLKAGEGVVSVLKQIIGEQDHSSIEVALSKAVSELAKAKMAQERVAEIALQIDGDEAPLVKKRTTEITQAAETKSGLDASKKDVTRIERELKALLGDQPSVAAYLVATSDELRQTEALAMAIEAAASASKSLAQSFAVAQKKATEQKFENLDQVEAASLYTTAIEAFQARIDEHRNSVTAQKAILELPRLQNLPKDLPTQAEAQDAVEAARDFASKVAELAGGLREKLTNAEVQLGSIKTQIAQLSELTTDSELKTRLHQTFDGRTPNSKNMPLEVYFMAAELESVLEAANLRLKTLSRGRFSLLHTDRGVGRANTQAGLGIEVMDENTGKPFDPHRFSGGETFLASLALALGLAEVVTSRNGGIKIDTLFVDEGFGTLDGEPLEDAMSILESLKSGGRTVGLISHVESLKERIPTQLKVNKTPNGPSIILQ